MLLYISGPYRGNVDANIKRARDIAITAWEMGHAVICPHMNTEHFELYSTLNEQAYIDGDMNMIARCDALVMVPGWEKSSGANQERDYAMSLGIPVYDHVPDLNLTEVRCPLQARAFLETIGQMYRTHLTKNSDYSPANILATGNVGLTTRLWDKVARFMNLTGYTISVVNDDKSMGVALWTIMDHIFRSVGMRVNIVARWTGIRREPKHEAIDDTLMDMAVYAIIGRLLRKGVWGK